MRRGRQMGGGGFSGARLDRMRDVMAGHVERGHAPGIVTLVSLMEAPGRWHFPYRGDEMGGHRSEELRVARDG